MEGKQQKHSYAPQWPHSNVCQFNTSEFVTAIDSKVYRVATTPFETKEMDVSKFVTEGDKIACIDFTTIQDEEFLAIGTEGKQGVLVKRPDTVVDKIPFKKQCVQCIIGANFGIAGGPSALFSERWGGVVWTGMKLNRTPTIKGLYREKTNGPDGGESVIDIALSAHVSAPIWMDSTGDGLVTVTYSDGVVKSFDLKAPFELLEMKTIDGVRRSFGSRQGGGCVLSYITLTDIGMQDHVATHRRSDTNSVEIAVISDGVLKTGTVLQGAAKWDRTSTDLPEGLVQEDIECLTLNNGKGFIFARGHLYRFESGAGRIEEIKEYSEWLKTVAKATPPV